MHKEYTHTNKHYVYNFFSLCFNNLSLRTKQFIAFCIAVLLKLLIFTSLNQCNTMPIMSSINFHQPKFLKYSRKLYISRIRIGGKKKEMVGIFFPYLYLYLLFNISVGLFDKFKCTYLKRKISNLQYTNSDILSSIFFDRFSPSLTSTHIKSQFDHLISLNIAICSCYKNNLKTFVIPWSQPP